MDQRLYNWAGNLVYGATQQKQAASEEEVIAFVRQGRPFKVLGTRHCFNTIADSKNGFISLAPMNRIVELDTTDLSVTVEAGIRYGELAAWLDDKGYALHNLASLPHISVAGGVATATHGSGVKNANLASAVRGMELITAAGDKVTLRRGVDEEFAGAVVHLGAPGVVTKLTLDIEPAFLVTQRVYEQLPFHVLEQDLEQVLSAGYSVSLFTDWRSDHISEVWIKSRRGDMLFEKADPSFFGAKAATQNLHPIKGLGAENCTEQMGVPGPWQERLPHFRMGFTPSSGDELQTEYFVPKAHAFEALKAVRSLADKIAPHLLISEIRSIAADELWMSPCYRQASVGIHFTWKPEWEAVRQLLPQIEERLAPFTTRPHWGKLFTMEHSQLAPLYPKLEDFKQLITKYDPEGLFRNAFLQQLLFGLA